MATLSPTSQPPTVPFPANIPVLDPHLPIKPFSQLARQYGEICQFLFSSGRIVLRVNSQPLLAQISDDERFKKMVNGPLEEVRNLVRSGLITAHLEEPNRGNARTLHFVIALLYSPMLHSSRPHSYAIVQRW